MSDDTRTGGAATPNRRSTPLCRSTDQQHERTPANGTRGETAHLRADALADAGSYVPGSDGVTEFGTIVIEDGVIPKRLRRPSISHDSRSPCFSRPPLSPSAGSPPGQPAD